MKLYFLTVLLMFLLSACSNYRDDGAIRVEQKNPYIFTSVGYAPIEVQSGSSFDVKMLNAIKASKLEAYKEMAEQVYGVLLTAISDVEGAVLVHDNIQSQVKGVVKGARIIRSYHEGDVYITELELDIRSLPLLKRAEFNYQGSYIIKVKEAVYY
jgi:hypothetical protein